MSKLPLSTNSATVERRERRFYADIKKQEEAWYVEIDALMARAIAPRCRQRLRRSDAADG